MKKVDSTRRKIIKKSWLVPTVIALGTLTAPAVAGASSVPVDLGVCSFNPNIPPCR